MQVTIPIDQPTSIGPQLYQRKQAHSYTSNENNMMVVSFFVKLVP